MELVARAGGTLLKQVVPAGATVPVSELVALIGEPGEAIDNGKPAPASEPQAPQTDLRTRIEPSRCRRRRPAPRRPARAEGDRQRAPRAASTAPAGPPAGRVKASPLARRIAAERGIDLGGIAGTGPEGRVVLRDLEGAPVGARSRPAAGARRRRRRRPGPGAAPPCRRPLARWRALHRRAADPDPEDHRPPAGAIDRPDPDVLPHHRGGHGAGVGRARRRSRRSATGRRCRSTTSSSRPWRPRCGSIPHATPGGRTTGSATGTRCTSAWPWPSRRGSSPR